MSARWLLLAFLFWSAQSGARCPQFTEMVQVPVANSTLEYWVLQVSADSLEHRPTDLPAEFPKLAAVQNQILEWIHPDPYFLLLRQMNLYQKHFGSLFRHNYEAILLGEVGNIREMRCLEALLLNFHYQRKGHIASEMGAWILRKDGHLRVHWVSSPEASVPTPDELVQSLVEELSPSSGPRAEVIHIHNHPFFLSTHPESDVAGTLIPSGSAESGDIATYRLHQTSWNLRQAFITNGFDTLELTPTDWANLH